jgi:HEPN domain-containing protein
MTGEQAAEQWLDGAKRALIAARHMSAAEDHEFALFTCHLCVEKALKGLFVKNHDTRAPKTHNLEELAKECGLKLTEDEKLELRELTTFSEFGRYGDDTWLLADATSGNTAHWLERVSYFLSLCDDEK